MKKQLIAIVVSLLVTFGAHAQWTGQSSSTDLVSPISRTGSVMTTNMFVNDGVNGAQIRLNSNGTYYGKIGNPSAQVWSLGWGGSVLDINPVLNWTATGNVGICTTSPRGQFDVAGTGHIYLVNSPVAGTDQTLYLPGHIFIAPYNGSDWSYLQARRSDNSGSTNLRFRTYNGGVLTEAMSILSNGNIGIGTVTPARPLHINNSAGGIVRLQSPTAVWDLQSDAFYNGNFGVVNYTGGSVDATKSLVINGSNGYFGIGTSLPDQKLTVKGIIHAQEIRVDLSVPGPDYVFDKNYELPTLKGVKDYIDQNKHLPEVPSAAEMEKKGVQLGEMNMLLLKKVEELTLYVIELKKEIDDLKPTANSPQKKTIE